MRSAFFTLIIVVLFSISLEAVEKEDEIFFNANQLYKEGKYEEALEKYLKLMELGRTSGHLYYNMGNTCYRLKSIGHAILYYERARILMPGDADLEYNLRYVRNLAKDVIEENPDILSMIFFWLDSITLNEAYWAFIIMNIIFWSSLIARQFIKEEWTYYLTIIFLIVWIIFGASFFKKWRDIKSDDRVVILAEEADILSGPESNDTILFKLHTGAIVRFEREEDGWMLIRLPDNKRGWVDGKSAELIRKS